MSAILLSMALMFVIPAPSAGKSQVRCAGDSVISVQPDRFDVSGLTGDLFAESLQVENLTGAELLVRIGESHDARTFHQRSRALPPPSANPWDFVQRLGFRPSLSGSFEVLPGAHAAPDADALRTFTTIIDDDRNENAFGGADVYRVDHQVRTFFGTTYHDFRIILGDLPDTNVVLIFSVDTDQDFGTGGFPAPGGVGLTSRDIGSEREILMDASGIIIDSLTGWGRIPAGVVIDTETDSIIGLPFLLAVSRDSVLTIATNAFNLGIQAGWLGDNDSNMSVGISAIRLSLNANPLPDFAPVPGHGTIGVETNVTWISESPHQLVIPSGETAAFSVTMLAARDPGMYESSLLVTVDGFDTMEVPVTMIVTGYGVPEIHLNPSAVTDTLRPGETDTVIVHVSNEGVTDLLWGFIDTASAPWLSADPLFGLTEEGGSSDVTLVLSTADLLPGNAYSTEFFVLSNDPSASFIALPVALYVEPETSVPPPAGIPGEFRLEQNYPNPFNPVTVIHYELPATGHAELSVIDMLGREIAILVNEVQSSGIHEVAWDGAGLSSGPYLYRLRSAGMIASRRLLLLK